MNCKKCGSAIDDRNTFCPNCGKRVRATKSNLKVKLILAIVAIIIVLGIIVAGCILERRNKEQSMFANRYEKFVENCSQYSLGDYNDEYIKLCDDAEEVMKENHTYKFDEMKILFKKFENELIKYQNQLAKYSDVETKYQQLFDSLQMDKEENEFIDLKEQFLKARDKSSLSEIEKVIIQLEKLYEDIKESNLEEITAKETELNIQNTDNLFDAENEIINDYITKAEQSKKEKNYKQSLMELNTCLELCEKLQSVDNFHFDVEQIDVSEFPKIRLYISSYDNYGKQVIPLKKDFLTIRQLGNDGYKRITSLKVNKLNQQERLNICLVADISGSMYGLLDDVEDAMYNFVNCLQFDKAHDEVSLITFDDNVYDTMDFTNNKNKALESVSNLYIGNCTALYDALYVAVCKTALTKGAKCVMAFTDGYDNSSTKTVKDVIKIANKYDIPIYLIGIGYDVECYELNDICGQTGGFFRQIWNSSEMTEVYESAFEKNKEMYLIEYDSDLNNLENVHNLYVSYDNGNDYLRCETEFIPANLQVDITEYEDIISDDQLKSEDTENEVLRIRAVYNDMVENINNGTYQKTDLANNVMQYSQNGNVRCVIVGKGVNNIAYTRYYYYENDKLMFAYLESKDSHRLYFYNDKLFRWRYAKNSVKFSEADNHDNEDSPDFRKWQDFALNEAYQYI